MQNDKPQLLEGEFISALDGPGHASSAIALLSYPDSVLRELTETDLIELMTNDEDRVPRNVIEECGRRGAQIEALLAPLFAEPMSDEEFEGHWWLRLHAINILGLISSESAGAMLLRAMQWLAENEEFDLGDWCSGYWHAWFRNKPDAVIRQVQRSASDKSIHLSARMELLAATIDVAAQLGPDWLEPQLGAMASLASDETEDHEIRMLSCQYLLDFPRERHKALLEKEARRQTGKRREFTVKEVRERYDAMTDEPQWRRFDNPLDFYSQQAIESRQSGGTEDSEFGFGEDFEFEPDMFPDDVPYVRETPKVGRNDPCPCGSGKKYKKCCLG